MIYNVVLVSGVQQSESVIRMPFNFKLYSVFKWNICLFSYLKYTGETCNSIDKEFAPHLCYRFKIVTCLDLSTMSCPEGIVALSPAAEGQSRVAQMQCEC